MPTSRFSKPLRLLVTMGDPAGIGPEVLLKALTGLRPSPSFLLTVVGDLSFLRSLARGLSLDVAWEKFRWIDLKDIPQDLSPGSVQPSAGRAAYQYLEKAVRLLKKGKADALVTAPVSKEAIARAGIPFQGHTEFLGKAFRCQTVMMFVLDHFRVSLVTTHVGIKELPFRLTKPKVIRTIRLTQEALCQDFGIRSPRIGLAALNPHGGEGGMFGREETSLLIPAAEKFRDGIEGPLPVDSLMREAARGKYDAVVALYHDQALIPIKLLGWEKAVNVTLGLPFIRTSPVHGTAFELAGKAKADPRSMRTAIRLALRLARQRVQGVGPASRLPAGEAGIGRSTGHLC